MEDRAASTTRRLDRDLCRVVRNEVPLPVIAASVGVLELAPSRGRSGDCARHPDSEFPTCCPVRRPFEWRTLLRPWANRRDGSSSTEQLRRSRGELRRTSRVDWGRCDRRHTRYTHAGLATRDLDAAYLPFIHGEGIAQYTSDPVFDSLVDERIARAAPRRRSRVCRPRRSVPPDMTRNYPGPSSPTFGPRARGRGRDVS